MSDPKVSSRENKTNWFPEGPNIKCFVIFLDFHLTKQGLPLVDSWSRGLA